MLVVRDISSLWTARPCDRRVEPTSSLPWNADRGFGGVEADIKKHVTLRHGKLSPERAISLLYLFLANLSPGMSDQKHLRFVGLMGLDALRASST